MQAIIKQKYGLELLQASREDVRMGEIAWKLFNEQEVGLQHGILGRLDPCHLARRANHLRRVRCMLEQLFSFCLF